MESRAIEIKYKSYIHAEVYTWNVMESQCFARERERAWQVTNEKRKKNSTLSFFFWGFWLLAWGFFLSFLILYIFLFIRWISYWNRFFCRLLQRYNHRWRFIQRKSTFLSSPSLYLSLCFFLPKCCIYFFHRKRFVRGRGRGH